MLRKNRLKLSKREWIKCKLRSTGSSLSAVAKELGISRQAVSMVFFHSYPRIEKVLAEKLGVEVELLFPERYSKKGTGRQS